MFLCVSVLVVYIGTSLHVHVPVCVNCYFIIGESVHEVCVLCLSLGLCVFLYELQAFVFQHVSAAIYSSAYVSSVR